MPTSAEHCVLEVVQNPSSELVDPAVRKYWKAETYQRFL